MADSPFSMTYTRVVSRDIAALNDLEILAGDIQNDYLKAPNKKKVFSYAGDECKLDQGRTFVISRDLYGLKFSPLAWKNH